jgi:subtilase family serine protease
MMIVPAYSFLGISDSGNNRAIKTIPINSIISIPQNELKFSPVKYAPGSVQSGLAHQFSGNVNVLVTFSLQNQSRLNSFLANLSNPNSPQYHQYISRGTFASEFGTTSSIYSEAVNYFSQFPGISVTKFSDHVSIQLKGPASSIGKAFNTTISTSAGGSIYHASSIPIYLSCLLNSAASFVSFFQSFSGRRTYQFSG